MTNRYPRPHRGQTWENRTRLHRGRRAVIVNTWGMVITLRHERTGRITETTLGHLLKDYRCVDPADPSDGLVNPDDDETGA